MSCSCHGDSLRLLRPPDLSLQGRAQQWQVTVAFDPPQARLDEAQRTGYPALFLVRRPPVIHLVGELAELRIQGFQTVGGLQAHPQNRKESQAMKRQRLLEAFVQAGHGREVDSPQLLTQLAQGRPGFGIRRALVGLLQPSTPGRLLPLREIAHHVLALVPLTALDQGLGSEHRLHGGAQPLGPVDDAEEAGLHPQSSRDQCTLECEQDQTRHQYYVMYTLSEYREEALFMREREKGKTGKRNVQIVRGREAFMRRKRVLASPLGGLQVIAAHLNELPGQRAQVVESDCPRHVKDEVDAWERAERIVSQPLVEAVDLFNGEAKMLPMFVQVELVQDETSTFIASREKHGDQREDMLRHLWWYYFPKNEWRRLKNCPVCHNWFVDMSKNRVTARCSSECTAQWWNRDRRKEAGHTLKTKGGKYGTKRRIGKKIRGVIYRRGSWWCRWFEHGRERVEKCDSKTQAAIRYGWHRAQLREHKFFPEKYAAKTITFRAWLAPLPGGLLRIGGFRMSACTIAVCRWDRWARYC